MSFSHKKATRLAPALTVCLRSEHFNTNAAVPYLLTRLPTASTRRCNSPSLPCEFRLFFGYPNCPVQRGRLYSVFALHGAQITSRCRCGQAHTDKPLTFFTLRRISAACDYIMRRFSWLPSLIACRSCLTLLTRSTATLRVPGSCRLARCATGAVLRHRRQTRPQGIWARSPRQPRGPLRPSRRLSATAITSKSIHLTLVCFALSVLA